MSDIIPSFNPQSSEPVSTAPVQPSADPTTAGNAAQANKTKKDFDAKTQISTLEDLRKAAPEVFKKMMEGIAMGIISKMRRAQDRLEEMWRESREQK
jgi:hypothetical protein